MTTIDANNPFGVSRTHHILSVLVQNRPGVLARVSGLFARRGYNIYSLAVAPTDDPRHSRITIVVDISETPLEQIINQLFKLIDVVRITEMSPSTSVERELLLVEMGQFRRHVAQHVARDEGLLGRRQRQFLVDRRVLEGHRRRLVLERAGAGDRLGRDGGGQDEGGDGRGGGRA